MRISGDVVIVLAAVGVGGELFAPVFEPSHRPFEMHRQPTDTDFLGQQNALVAKAAADVRRDHADLALVEPETMREPAARDVRHLR
jgi:hypothetical protein